MPRYETFRKEGGCRPRRSAADDRHGRLLSSISTYRRSPRIGTESSRPRSAVPGKPNFGTPGRAIAEALPLVYFIRLVRDVMVFGDPIWEHPGDVAMVAAWGVVGAVVAFRWFRWEPRER